MTDARRAELLAMKPYQLQAELLRIEIAMGRLGTSPHSSRVLCELVYRFHALEGAVEINEGTQAMDLVSHTLKTIDEGPSRQEDGK